jgi:ribose transport system substrate-binding protein
MMSRTFSLAVAVLALAGSITGCERQPASAPKPAAGTGTAAPAMAKKLRIGVSVPSADHGWTAGVGYWAKEAMELYPDVEWQYQTADNAERQASQIDAMVVKGLDALVVLAHNSEGLTSTAERVKDKGVFIVNVDRGFTKPIADIFLEGDNKAFGRKSAQFVAEKMGGKGNLVILQGISGTTVNTDRVNAAMEVFKGFPEIKILDSQPADWSREKGLSVMKTFLTKHPKIDAVWAQDDDIMMGVLQAIKEAGREKEMWVLGGAGMKEAVKMLMDGDTRVPANITYPPSMVAMGVHLAVSTLRDGKQADIMKFTPRHLMIDVDLVTPANAKEYYFPDSVY